MAGEHAKSLLQRLDGLDRRWIFLLMAVAEIGRAHV